MPIREDDVRAALDRVVYPGYERSITSLGVVREIRLDGSAVEVRIDPGGARPEVRRALEQAVRDGLAGLEGVDSVRVLAGDARGASPALNVVSDRRNLAAEGGLDAGLLPQVRHVVAVASGKGGVGKSTVAVNLAVALARRGLAVGLFDADLYGPSIPLMFGLAGEKARTAPGGQVLVPFEKFGVRFMSIGFLADPDTAVIWRGPMVMKAIEQLLGETDWGKLDVLVVDMPPGTGDTQLTMAQKVNLAGAVIVTTPQDVALADAVKGINMFRKVDVPVLGLVENMSFFRCPHCGENSEIFGHGGGREAAERLGVPFLGEIPLHGTIRESGDRGQPVALEDGPQGDPFARVAERLAERLAPAEADPDTGEGGSVFDRFRGLWSGGTR